MRKNSAGKTNEMPTQEFAITRLPNNLTRRESGLLKDHVVLLSLDGVHTQALRVDGTYAGYLAGVMAELASSPAKTAILERRLIEDKNISPDTRTLLHAMLRQAQSMQEAQAST